MPTDPTVTQKQTDPGSNTPPAGAKGADSSTKSEEDKPDTAGKAYSQAQVDELLSKTRKEEKDKLYADLEKARTAVTTKDKELENLSSSLQEKQKKEDELSKKLQEVEEKSLSKEEKLEKRLSSLEDTSTKAMDTSTRALEAAKSENAKLRVEIYRERAVRESQLGPEFADLVKGSSPEEIDAAVQAAKTRETQMANRMRTQLREEIARELGAKIPEDSAAGDPAGSATEHASVDLETRRDLVQIRDKSQYRAQRDKLKAEALAKVSDSHPLKQKRRRA